MKFIVNSNIWISFGAIALLFATDVLANEGISSLHLYSIVFFSTLLTYNWQRMLSVKKRQQHAISQLSQWMGRNLFWGTLASAVALAICSYNFFQLAQKQQAALIILGLVSVIYALPLLPSPRGFIRLRDFGFAKPVVLGITWGITTTLLPLLAIAHDGQVTWYGYNNDWLIVARCLTMIGICIPFDIKDMNFDRATMAYPTLPVKLGIKRTLVLSHLFLLAGFVAISLWWAQTDWAWPVLLGIIVSLGFEIGLIYRTKETSNEWHYAFKLDGLLILHTILVAGSALLWGWCNGSINNF